MSEVSGEKNKKKNCNRAVVHVIKRAKYYWKRFKNNVYQQIGVYRTGIMSSVETAREQMTDKNFEMDNIIYGRCKRWTRSYQKITFVPDEQKDACGKKIVTRVVMRKQTCTNKIVRASVFFFFKIKNLLIKYK